MQGGGLGFISTEGEEEVWTLGCRDGAKDSTRDNKAWIRSYDSGENAGTDGGKAGVKGSFLLTSVLIFFHTYTFLSQTIAVSLFPPVSTTVLQPRLAQCLMAQCCSVPCPLHSLTVKTWQHTQAQQVSSPTPRRTVQL